MKEAKMPALHFYVLDIKIIKPYRQTKVLEETSNPLKP